MPFVILSELEEQIDKKSCNHILCHRLSREAQCMGTGFLKIQETPGMGWLAELVVVQETR